DQLRERVRSNGPILELPDLVARMVQGRIVLLGTGALGRSVYSALSAVGNTPVAWGTRAPRSKRHTTIPHALSQLQPGDTLICALAVEKGILDAASLPNRSGTRWGWTIDLSKPKAIIGANMGIAEMIQQSGPLLAAQAESVKRAAHR